MLYNELNGFMYVTFALVLFRLLFLLSNRKQTIPYAFQINICLVLITKYSWIFVYNFLVLNAVFKSAD